MGENCDIILGMKNYQKGFVGPLLIIIGLVIVGGSAYYLGTRQVNMVDDTKEINTNIPVISTEDEKNIAIPTNKPVISVNNSKPTITVLSPNGGETIKSGSVQNITWDSMSLGTSTVTINLVDESKICPVGITGCQSSFGIDFGVKNTGSYSWDTNKKMFGGSTGPNSVSAVPGSKYKIEICKDYSTICDRSNNVFTMSSI